MLGEQNRFERCLLMRWQVSLISRAWIRFKKASVAMAIVSLAILVPVAVTAQDAAKIDSTVGVANVTAGDTDYKSSINASNDQLVKLQMYYVNQEAADSNRNASALRAKINLPASGERSKVISGWVKGQNTDVVEKEVTITNDRDGLQLQYIPGTAIWKRNTGTAQQPKIEETKVSDEIVNGDQGILVGDIKPGESFGGTVSITMRVVAPGVKVTLQSQKKGATNQWSGSNTAAPGDTMRYLIGYQNTSTSQQRVVLARANLPTNVAIGPGTTAITNSINPNGLAIEGDAVAAAGIDIGNYDAGANGFVSFDALMPAADKLQCGDNEIRTIATVKPEGAQEYYASAVTNVRRDCQPQDAPAPAPSPTPAPARDAAPAPAPAPAAAYSCDNLTLTKKAGRAVEAKVDYTARNGASLKTITYNFGDGSTPMITDRTTVNHSYAKDGEYQVSVSLLVSANGKDETVTSANCAKRVSFAPEAATPAPAAPTTPSATPSSLPDTGTAEVLGLAAVVSIVAAVLHRLYLQRKLSV